MPTTLSWGDADLDNGTDDGIVHADVVNTDLTDASEIRKAEDPENPLHSTNLEVFYPMMEPSGSTLYDFSGNNRDDAYEGTQAAAYDLVGLGHRGYDGSNDYVQLSSGDDLVNKYSSNTGPFTFAFWFYEESTDEVNELYNARGNRINLQHFDDGTIGGDLRFQLFDGSSFTGVDVPDSDVSRGEWHHLVASYDDARDPDMQVVVDGDPTNKKYTNNFNSSIEQDLREEYIGRGPSGEYLNGALANFRFWSRTLSDSEIEALYGVIGNLSKHTAVTKST